MQRKVHTLVIHSVDKASHSLHHHRHVAGLYGYDYVVEIMTHGNAQKFHGALHHAGRSIAVTTHDAVAQ